MNKRPWVRKILSFILILCILPARLNVLAAGSPSQVLNSKNIVFKAKVVINDKIWNTTNTLDKNIQDRTNCDTYYYPWQGDDQAQVTGVIFTDLTQDQQRYIDDYGISISCNPITDVSSAAIDMNFIGQRPVTITWTKAPSLAVSRQDQAGADGYTFSLTLEDPVCTVLDTGEEGITEEEYASYYEKAKKACQVILKCCQDKNTFGDKDNPAFLKVDVWSVLTAARCGYVPYDDEEYYDRWYENTVEYLQNEGANLKKWKTTDLAKIALAIEAIGYDPRDVGGINLLEYVGLRNGSEWYTNEYAIHAIKAGFFETETFPENEMEAWVHQKAASLKKVKDSSLKNADNTMGWQPLIYWYGQEGFEDVTEAIDQAEQRLPLIAQRATGAFCTEGFETGCATYGNNPWNNAQAVIFASVADINIMDPATGYTKNGNNILDAMLFHVDLEENTMYGLTYDPPQIARALNAFVRMYERNILHKDTKHFWDFTDAGGREEQIPIERTIKLIEGIPDIDILTLKDRSAVEKARNAYEALTDNQKAQISDECLSKLTASEDIIAKMDAEQKINEQEARDVEAKINAIGTVTLSKETAILEARKAYNTLKTDVKSMVDASVLSKLVAAEKKLETLKREEERKKFTPGKAKITKIFSGKKKVKLKWKKITSASGYEIQMSRKKTSGFKKIATIKKAKIVTYTKKKLKPKKTMYFRVRAYRTVGKYIYYGAYSAVKKAKVK